MLQPPGLQVGKVSPDRQYSIANDVAAAQRAEPITPQGAGSALTGLGVRKSQISHFCGTDGCMAWLQSARLAG